MAQQIAVGARLAQTAVALAATLADRERHRDVGMARLDGLKQSAEPLVCGVGVLAALEDERPEAGGVAVLQAGEYLLVREAVAADVAVVAADAAVEAVAAAEVGELDQPADVDGVAEDALPGVIGETGGIAPVFGRGDVEKTPPVGEVEAVAGDEAVNEVSCGHDESLAMRDLAVTPGSIPSLPQRELMTSAGASTATLMTATLRRA